MDIYEDFDSHHLPFTFDCEKSIEVFTQSKEHIASSGIQNRVARSGWAFQSLFTLFPITDQNIISGHMFPWIDSWEELQISFNLCMFGFYKQAMSSLRSALELGLLSVYWNLNDDGHYVIQEWIKSSKNTPSTQDIWNKTAKHVNFAKFQQDYDIKARLLFLNYLHDYVHTKGIKHSNRLGLLKSNCQTFEKGGMLTWLDAYEEVVTVLIILHLVKYPIGTFRFDYSSKLGMDTPAFGSLEEFEIDRIESIIGEEIFKIIESIAKADQLTQDMISWVKNLPDITEEKYEEQIRDFDKFQIKGMGLEQWLQNERVFPKEIPVTEKYNERIKYLKEWARENNYEKSILERKKITLK